MNKLYIFVEGDYDEKFFSNIIKSKFEKKGYFVKIMKYAEQTKEYVKNFIKSINAIPNADYIFLADINSEPCITLKKQELKRRYENLDTNKIIVVKKEIESWYLAGLDQTKLKKLKIKFTNKNHYYNTESITKEEFEKLIPDNLKRTEFYLSILENFCIDTACQKNKTFNYFIKKYNIF